MFSLVACSTTPTAISTSEKTPQALTIPTGTALPGTVNFPKSTEPTPTLPPSVVQEGLTQQGVIFLSMSDGLNIHLFAYHPQYLPLTRLTNSPWDDLHPSVSPDGKTLAYSSRQNGYWDIYLYDLQTGRSTRLTDTPEYEGSPSWSSDGQWLVFERYLNNSTQLMIFPVYDRSATASSIQLTNFASSCYSPQWSPQGRDIAFVSNLSGREDIYLARLDRIDDRFTNLTHNLPGSHRTPNWSPDGSLLAWSSQDQGLNSVQIWDTQAQRLVTQLPGAGDHPTWNSRGDAILTEMRSPNQTGLSAFRISDGALLYPLNALPGAVFGLDWQAGTAAQNVTKLALPAGARQPNGKLWKPALTISPAPPQGRVPLVNLKDVQTPYSYLQDSVDESFIGLRDAIAQLLGWDFLANLENAYVPLTTSSAPGMDESWLYTGRAIAVNPLPITAGWMTIAREEINGQTFWRVFLRSRYQDGSQGLPVTGLAWDLNARNSGDPFAYDQGGAYIPAPEGYWVDFTELAARFNWERQPALVSWRTYYLAIRYNTFVLRENLDWVNAMKQVYPPEALATPTPWITVTLTLTPTRTVWWNRLITPSLTPTVTPTPTFRPTLTPLATQKP